MITETQQKVLYMFSTGLSYKQIATKLGIHRATVQRHVAMARERLGAATLPQAVAMYVLFFKPDAQLPQ